jgi:hypothetical protein
MLSKQGPKTVTAKTKIQSKSREDEKKKQERKRGMQLTSRGASPTATGVQKSIQRLEFLDVDAEICARNPKTNKT